MGPFPLDATIGKTATYLLYVLIGMGFGVALETVGFGRSTKLTAQFYLRDMTVFKVMFTAVLAAMVLVYGFAGLGWLDFDRIWVPPTYLLPGALGGLLVGAGLLMLFRHRASLGGINVVALFLQDRLGWRAGRVQMLVDVAILMLAFGVTDAWHVALSVLGAVMLNLALAINHRPGRYMAV